jgi:hypothetical protein
LSAVGLQPVWLGTIAPEYDTFSFVQSLLNWIGVRPNYLYNCLRGRKAKVTADGKHPGSFVVTLLLAPLLGLVSVPATLLLGLLGQGSALTICALKASPSDSKKP